MCFTPRGREGFASLVGPVAMSTVTTTEISCGRGELAPWARGLGLRCGLEAWLEALAATRLRLGNERTHVHASSPEGAQRGGITHALEEPTLAVDLKLGLEQELVFLVGHVEVILEAEVVMKRLPARTVDARTEEAQALGLLTPDLEREAVLVLVSGSHEAPACLPEPPHSLFLLTLGLSRGSSPLTPGLVSRLLLTCLLLTCLTATLALTIALFTLF